MATPTDDDLTYPCRLCAGSRVLEQMAWRDPQIWVTCQGCGNTEGGTTDEEAIAAWNDANPDRDVDPADVQALHVQLLQQQLTPSVVQALDAAATTYGMTGEPDTVTAFLTWVHAQVVQPAPTGD